MRRLLPRPMWPYIDSGLGHYLLLMAAVVAGLGALLGVLYYQQAQTLLDPLLLPALRTGFIKVFCVLSLASGIIAWWLVLTHKSRQVAQEESNRQTSSADARDRLAPADRRSPAGCQAGGGRRQSGWRPLHHHQVLN